LTPNKATFFTKYHLIKHWWSCRKMMFSVLTAFTI
jgi:hypothetical protein